MSEDEAAGGSEPRPELEKACGHYLAKCVLRGSAVLQAVSGHLRSPFSDDVVFGKETSLELVVVSEDGIVQSVCEQTVFGVIKDLAILPWNEKFRVSTPQMQGKDLLVVLSDSGKLSFLAFCSEMHRFFAVVHIQLSRPGNSKAELGKMLAVDSEGCFVAVSASKDQFALFCVSKSAGNNIVDEKILYPPESEGEASTVRDTLRTNISGTIWSMCFISKGTNHLSREGYNPVLAILMNRRGAVANDLLLFGGNLRTRTIHAISQYSEPGTLAFSISAVPHLSGFALLFRTTDVLLMDLRDPHNISCTQRMNSNFACVIEERSSVEEAGRSIDVDDEGMFNVAASALLELRDSVDDMVKLDDPMNIDSGSDNITSTPKLVCSWSWEPGGSASSKLIFCFDTGELHIIEIYSDIEGIKFNLSDCLYKGFPCNVLLWVKGGLIAGLVEMGDGLVLKLEHGRLLYKSPIQNIAPILDLSVDDHHDEKQDQMFACCGMNPEGSLRIIRSGISVEKLLRTPPIYQGITGTWTLKMKESDSYHSFLVLSFVEGTRVLSVGLSFFDISDATGFQADVCTLACGLVSDGLLVQIHQTGVRLCLPTIGGHPEGVPLSAPVCSSWYPDKMSISLGAVGHNLVIIATSNPCFLFVLGVRSLSSYQYELYEIQHVRLQHEVSCISIPRGRVNQEQQTSGITIVNSIDQANVPNKVASTAFVIGTHKPSVEIMSFVPEEGLKVLAIGTISINSALGTPLSGCIPEDVRLVSVDRSYILSGLRNGMLLRYEWPASPAVPLSELGSRSQSYTHFVSKMDSSSSSIKTSYSFGKMMERTEDLMPVLQLIAIRCIGITPVFLVPLQESLDADIIVLSDRPWLLHSSRHSLAYTSISFQPATHVTPVCSVDCPKGLLFVSDNSLHLVEMVHTKRLNVQKFSVGGTPRKVLYHSKSKTLLVMRNGLIGASCSSDICRVDPLSGRLLSKFSCEPGEVAKCMQIVKVRNEQVLVVGTSQSAGRIIMPSGEAESTKGRLIVISLDNTQRSSDSSSLICSSSLSPSSQNSSPFREIVGYATEQLSSSSLCSSPDDPNGDGVKCEEMEAIQLQLISQTQLPGAVLSVCPYLDLYVLASAGNMLYVFNFLKENPPRLRKVAMAKTRFTITCLATNFTRIAVGDCRDGILFYSFHEDLRKLEQLYSDPGQRLVADCAFMDLDTVVVSDRRGNISILSCANNLEGNESPEKNLMLRCSFNIGETVMSIQKGSFPYKLPVDGVINSCDNSEVIVAGSLLGSVFILIPITREEHEILETVQDRLVVHPLTSPILGNDHREFRGHRSLAGTPIILDGDMLAQFLELTSMQQEAVLASSGVQRLRSSSSGHPPQTPISISQVVRLLERVHYALN